MITVVLAVLALLPGSALKPHKTAIPSQLVTIEGGIGVVYSCGDGLPDAPRVTITEDSGLVHDLRVSRGMMATFKNYAELVGHRLAIRGEVLPDGSIQVSDAADAPSIRKDLSTLRTATQKAIQSPQSGSKPFLTILVRFADRLGVTPHPVSWYQSLLITGNPGLNPYYQANSYQAINLNGSVVLDWVNLAKKTTDYNNSSLAIGADDEAVVKDAIAAVTGKVDFTKFYGINVVSNGQIGKFGGTGGRNTYTLNGVTRLWGRTYDNDGSGMFALLAHEMGHALGFDHSSGPYNTPYDSDWDVMSRGSNYNYSGPFGPIPVLTNSYHRNIVGWIPKDRIFYGLPGSDTTIRLEQTGNPSKNGFLTARIFPYGGGLHYLTLESRRFAGDNDHSGSLPHEGVVIHDVQEQRVTNDYWTGKPTVNGRNSEVVDLTNDNNPNDSGAVRTVGQSWTDPKGYVQLDVTGSDVTSYTVRVRVSSAAPPPDEIRNVSDQGDSSLRSILYYGNERPNQILHANLPANAGPIAVLSPLPAITQEGTTLDCLGNLSPSLGAKVQVDGSASGQWGDGIQVRAKNVTIKGIAVGNFPWSGISIVDSAGASVVGCFAGTDLAGSKGMANKGNGLDVRGISPGGTVSYCLFSGNGSNGSYFEGPQVTGWKILGSKFGSDFAGLTSIPNTYNGIQFSKGITNCTVGGPGKADPNLLSGNSGSGIWIGDVGTSAITITNNLSGTDISGTRALPNKYSGIVIGAGVSNATISGNVCSGNTTGIGVYDGASKIVLQGNYCGTDKTGLIALPNTNNGIELGNKATGSITKNLCSGNKSNGIDVFGAGTSGVTITGNIAGLNASGLALLPNGSFGIVVSGGPKGTDVSGNLVVGSNNGGAIGVWSSTNGTIRGNMVGLDIQGRALTGALGSISVAQKSTGWRIGGNTQADRDILACGGIGLYDAGTASNVVVGNWVGFDANGKGAPASGSSGISIGNGASGNTIGGSGSGQGNVVGNSVGNGIAIWGAGSDGNTVVGNLVGLDPTGLIPAPIKYQGISVQSGAKGNTVGGISSSMANRVAGVTNGAVSIIGAGTNNNLVVGNIFGTKSDGSVIGNGWGGVQIGQSASTNSIVGNTIVGFTGVAVAIYDKGTAGNSVYQNTIGTNQSLAKLNSGWAGVGIWGGACKNIIGDKGIGNLISGSQIGIVINDPTSIGNTLRDNRLLLNTNQAIDLGSNGVTANDPLDVDTGPNNFQNFPTISVGSATGGNSQVTITLKSAANKAYTVDLYSSGATNSNGAGAPDLLLTPMSLRTNSLGVATTSVSVSRTYSALCAIATDVLTGDTSEVSPAVLNVARNRSRRAGFRSDRGSPRPYLGGSKFLASVLGSN
jgi:M6 family metalloprotease-like protein